MSSTGRGRAEDRGAVRVAILDDRFDTLRTLPCFEKLAGHDVTVFTDHIGDIETLARRLAADARRSGPRSWSGCRGSA